MPLSNLPLELICRIPSVFAYLETHLQIVRNRICKCVHADWDTITQLSARTHTHTHLVISKPLELHRWRGPTAIGNCWSNTDLAPIWGFVRKFQNLSASGKSGQKSHRVNHRHKRHVSSRAVIPSVFHQLLHLMCAGTDLWRSAALAAIITICMSNWGKKLKDVDLTATCLKREWN